MLKVYSPKFNLHQMSRFLEQIFKNTAQEGKMGGGIYRVKQDCQTDYLC